MAAVLSTNYSAQHLALTRGPGRGVSAPTAAAVLRIMSDKASMPVGVIATATDYVRFMRVPSGAIIYPSLSYLSTNHTATIAGKLQLVPIDGTAITQEIATVVANLEATETTSIPDVADDVVVAKDCWVQFVPAADTTIATTAKDIRLRLAYGQTY